MSATTMTPPPVATAAPTVAPTRPAPIRRSRLHRLSVAQYRVMIDAGMLPAGSKVELVEGLLLRKPMTRKPLHDFTLGLLDTAVRAA